MLQPIVTSFAQVARTHPERVAIRWRRREWTYGELLSAIEQVTHAVQKRGVQRGDRVALLVRNSPQYVALFYGVLAAGCVAVPLNAQERAGVLSRQVLHSGAKVLFAEQDHAEYNALIAAMSDAAVQVVPIRLVDSSDACSAFAVDVGSEQGTAAADDALDALAMLIYTSGTTGRPKAVMLSHRNLASNTSVIIDYLGLESSDRGLCVLPFHFSYGNSVLNTHLLAGASLSIEDNFAFPQAVVRRMQDEKITGFAGVPSTFALLLGRCKIEDFDLSALRYVTQAGGAMARSMIDRVRRVLPHTRVFIMYGQTEATARLTYLEPELLETKLGSVGKALAGTTIEVRDSEDRKLPAGKVGEVCARGPNIMLGYWRDEDASHAALRDAWLHTGDLGHTDEEGFLYIDGRVVEMIKVGAFRVSPQEVEEVISAISGVQEVGVTGITDDVLGQAIKAVIVPTADATIDVMRVKAHCRQHLASYKVPKVVEFAGALPRTSSGKVQRFKLA